MMDDIIQSSSKRQSETCAHWLPKKKRFCLTRPTSGLGYCPSHMARAVEEDAPSPCQSGVTVPGIDHDKTPASDVKLVVETTAHDLGGNLNPSSTEKSNRGSGKKCPSENSDVSKLPPIPDRCHFWLDRKNRYCKARVSGGVLYCVEHSVGGQSEHTRSRIACPNDSKHSCYADQLERHLKKCNARRELRAVYYVDGINAGELNDDVSLDSAKVGIHDIDMAELNGIIELVKELHRENVWMTTSILSHDALKGEIEKPTNGSVALKHLQQQSSLIGNLEASGLLKDKCSYLEFGAGKGGLSHWIQLANKHNTNTKYLLIDKSSVRYKMDSYHKGDDQGPNFERLKIDIENLDLSKLKSLSSSNWPMIGTGKHLCGAATDLMLRCLVKAAQDSVHNCHVDGLVVALCCHHRCDWKAYVAKDWFKELGLNARHFALITSMSAWATCGTRPVTGTTSTEESTYESHEQTANQTDYNHPRYGKLLPEQRQDIGFKCKQLIDMGRFHYLMSNNFDPKLIYYVDKTLTLENTAITAVWHTCCERT